jgi:DNA repair protein RecO (recombination protein O)
VQVQEKVFILKTTRYGDTDLIIQALSSKGARLSFFARSALKSKKRFGGGVLEPTHYVHVLYDDKSSSAKSEHPLHVLKEASLIEGFEGLRGDYERIEAGLHFVRLVGDVVREGDLDSAEIFNLLGNTLRAAEKSARLDKLRIHFEVKLLSNQGVLPHEPEEQVLLRAPVSAHEVISLSDTDWNRVRNRIRVVLREYLEHRAPVD